MRHFSRFYLIIICLLTSCGENVPLEKTEKTTVNKTVALVVEKEDVINVQEPKLSDNEVSLALQLKINNINGRVTRG